MRFRTLGLLAALLLGACSGGYSGGTAVGAPEGGGPGGGDPGGGDPGGGDTGSGSTLFTGPEDFYAKRIAPRLEFCRSCHVPNGVADVEDGRGLMLGATAAGDYAKLKASWLALGSNNPVSRILRMPSKTDTRPHSGGYPWPEGSAAYRDMAILLACFQNPVGCLGAATGGPVVVEELPLLGSQRGGHHWFDYCADKGDDTPVPVDPRELVVPGVNHDKAVAMNAYWQTCQTDNHPGTCGELRARAARGFRLIASDGEVGAGSMFAGDSASSSFAFPASAYNTMWQRIWQLRERPDNYDELVAQRWGMPLSETHNPYPLPGEDPNATDGGSGQLPIGLTQLREADGRWTGNLSTTCSICHGGQVGSNEDAEELGVIYGTNSQSDITVMFTDLAFLAPQQGALAGISQNKVRGTGNITNFQLFGTLTLWDDLPGYLSVQTQPSTGTEDPPVWWNVGHRPMKFFDAGMPTDAKRIELSFYFPGVATPNNDAGKAWITSHMQDGDTWLMSLRSPAWPEARLGAINTALAEQGAILFHNKDLWAEELDNPVARPPVGNGSCASCHGAYAPRYVHDPAFLDTPLLEGIAAYVTPIDIIATDRKRLDGHSETVSQYARRNWFAYADGPVNGDGVPLCGSQNDAAVRGERELGYLAPPLYGVWATPPYFHNGSVPNVEAVLDPTQRPAYWRRLSNAARADQQGSVVMGFDASLTTGYDAARLGWNHEVLSCGVGSLPLVDCNPLEDEGATVQDGLGLLWANGGLAWNLLNLPILTPQQIEDRKVYNTKYYSQNNGGHAFTGVLTATERRAILEYLKTL